MDSFDASYLVNGTVALIVPHPKNISTPSSDLSKAIEKAWELLQKKPELSIEVHCSEGDIQDLQEFEEFNWRFPTLEDSEQSVNVRLFQGDEPDE